MPVLVKFNDPSNLSAKEVYYPSAGDNLLDFLNDNFTANFGGLHTDIYINKELLLSTSDISDSEKLNSMADRVILESDSIAVITRPADPVTALYIIVAALAIAAVVLLAPKVPGGAESKSSSPNNQLNAATNEFRPNQGIPEIFGSPASYPDFVQPSHYLYENNIKIQRELFCIGVGSYTVGSVRSGETKISDIPSSAYTIYDTIIDGIPPQERRVNVRETNEISNQSMPTANDSSIKSVYDTSFPDAITSESGNTKVFIRDSDIANMGLSIGDFVSVKATEVPSGGGTVTLIMNGTWQIVGFEPNFMILPTGSLFFSGEGYTVSIEVEKTDSAGDAGGWVGWFGVSGADVSEVWFHFVMPRGVRSGAGGELEISMGMQIRQVDENGFPIVGGYTDSLAESVTANTLDAQYRTYKLTGLTKGRYEARVINTSIKSGDNALEALHIEQIVGVEYQGAPDYGDVTLLWVERRGSSQNVGGNQSKINVGLTRKLPYYNRLTGLIEYNNLVATRDFADAAMYTLVIAGKRDINTVDLEELYRINDALPEALRTFDFTFDDADVGLRERISVICNVARVLAFKDYQSWTFNRIEAKASHSMLFNRRNTIGDSNQSFPQWLPSDKDSVSITYVTQPDNVEKTAYRRVVNGVILSDEAGSYPLEINLVGCQSDEQAQNRADYEIRSLLYQRDSVEFQTYYFGLSARIGDKVRWCDMNDHAVFGGEILDIFGDDYLTSEKINFESGKTYYVQTTKEDGTVGALVSCSALSYTDKGFKSSALAGAYTANDGNYEFGSKYVIAPDDELKGTDYTLKSVANSGDGIATITLSEYNDKIFEED